jgi:prevent-host-death family protein
MLRHFRYHITLRIGTQPYEKIQAQKYPLTNQSEYSTFNVLNKLCFGGNNMNINLKEDIKPISYIKTNAADMLEYVNERKNPIIITQHGEARGVLLDVESYQELLRALTLMKLLQISEEAIRGGDVYDHTEVFAEARKRLVK